MVEIRNNVSSCCQRGDFCVVAVGISLALMAVMRGSDIPMVGGTEVEGKEDALKTGTLKEEAGMLCAVVFGELGITRYGNDGVSC